MPVADGPVGTLPSEQGLKLEQVAIGSAAEV